MIITSLALYLFVSNYNNVKYEIGMQILILFINEFKLFFKMRIPMKNH